MQKTKTVLIVGASSGIGLESAKLFSQKGWNVIPTFFSNRQVTEEHPDLRWCFFDITDDTKAASFIEGLPKLDALVICAARNVAQSLGSTEEVSDIFDVTVVSHIKLLARLREKLHSPSSVVLFGSITGRKGSERRIAYSASKAAIHGLTKSLSAELAPETRVNAVCPGYIKTAQYIKTSTIPEEERKRSILLKRLGAPEDVARLVFFLASDDSSYITGQVINIDGGVL